MLIIKNNMKKLFAFLSALFFGIFCYGGTVYTPVFGSYSVKCPANADTFVSIPFTRPSEYCGKVQSAAMNGEFLDVIVDGEPHWAENQFVYDASSQRNYYYLKFTSGNLEGAWYNVRANGAYTLSLEFGEGELSEISAGDTFEIIPHWSLSTLFPNGGNFTKNTIGAFGYNATKIYKYTGFEDGHIIEPDPGVNNAFKAVYYYRKFGTTDSWMNGKTPVPDDIIEPNCFLRVRQPAGSDVVADISGILPSCATTVVSYTLSSNTTQDNYISFSNPVDIKLSDLTSALIDSGVFTPTTSSAPIAEDRLYVYDNSTAELDPAASNVYFYRSVGNVGWFNGKTLANDDIIKAGSAIVLRKKGTADPVAFRGKFTPFYKK